MATAAAILPPEGPEW
jgi:hypothetical protein